MKLIKELSEEVEFISEAREDGSKNHYIKGIFIMTETVNKNGRKYVKKDMIPEVTRYVKEVVENNRAYGELGHPAGPQINLDRVSHIIKEMHWDGNNVIGKALITKTPMGEIARGLMESGAQLGVSTRGMGSLKESGGIMIVQSDYRIATGGDIVADPSAPQAFVQGVMENVEWIYDPVKDTWYEERLENIKKEVNKMSRSQLAEQHVAIFENYLASLVSKNK